MIQSLECSLEGKKAKEIDITKGSDKKVETEIP